jgi:plastocyanin
MSTDDRRQGTVKMRVLIAGAIAIGSLGLAACGGDDDDDSSSDTSDTTAGTPSGDSVAYEVTDLAYTDVTAPGGATIEITNSSGSPHTFTADDDELFESDVPADGTAEVTAPDEAGDYGFHCEIHSSMKATLTVE